MKAPFKFYQGKNVRFIPPDEEWLRYHYHTLGKTQERLAEEIDCDRATLKRWIKKLSLRKKLKDSRFRYEVPSKEWLEHQYLILDKSIRDIAQEMKCSIQPVQNWLREHNIQKPKEQLAETHSNRMSGAGGPTWKGDTSQNYQRRALIKSGRPYQCEWCGHTKRLEVYHRDHDRSNGAMDNLAWMCRHCNMLEAHLWPLQQKGRADVLVEANQIVIRFKNKMGTTKTAPIGAQ